VEHGYFREPDGKFITFEAPGVGTTPTPTPCPYIGMQGTTPGDINPTGEIAGIVMDANNVWHGFVRTPDGKFEVFDPPGAGKEPFQGTWVSFAAGLAANGNAAGWYIDETNTNPAEVSRRISPCDAPCYLRLICEGSAFGLQYFRGLMGSLALRPGDSLTILFRWLRQ